MAALKISDRAEILRIVLTKAFEPRFNEVADKTRRLARGTLDALHPVFVKLYADEESRAYLAVCSMNHFYFTVGGKGARAAIPVYGKAVSMPDNTWHLDRESYKSFGEIYAPTRPNEFTVGDAALTQAYVKTWAKYLAAHSKLSALLNSYTTREKLASDFPEYAKYLPKIESKAKLPAVIVKDVRAELASLGVPAK